MNYKGSDLSKLALVTGGLVQRLVYGVLGDSKLVKSFNIRLSTVLIVCLIYFFLKQIIKTVRTF
jgi:hypothetical protein